ncbi:MAG: DUF58 domain-containing protein [Verrucomicrobiota bacterium]
MLDEIEIHLNALELKCRQPVEHLLAGEYRSVFRGRGVEFEDVRPYQPGDDVRTMDWKVTARTGEPHIKRYIEEREQLIYLLVDVSASMRHDTQGRKRKTVSEFCSLLTLAAIKNQDRIGLILFTDRIEQVIPPAKGRSQAMRIMDELMHFKPVGTGTRLSETLGRFGCMAQKHSIVFVVSDFLTEDFVLELQALAFKHDVNAIHLAETPVSTSPVSGLMRMEDSETGVQRVVDLKMSEDLNHRRENQLKQEMSNSGVHLLNLEAGANCVEALAGFFRARQRITLSETGG